MKRTSTVGQTVGRTVRRAARRVRPEQGEDSLARRVADLEAEVSEMRRHNLRLAELTDVVQELLVPLASRDQERIDEAIATFNKSL